MSQPAYVGRYAPSPTGRLHHGNLRSAALAWADARAHGGRFLLRMEDIDAPRVVPGAAEIILADLAALGLDWDGEVAWQSQRLSLYQDALARLRAEGRVFPCRCSRSDVLRASSAPHGPEGPIYPGTCRGVPLEELERLRDRERALSWRFHVPPGSVEQVQDRRIGPWREDVAAQVGDFVLQRSDGLFAYQLACVVDDIGQGVTDVVRGEDLVDSAARQQLLWRALGASPPRWLHLPLVNGPEGGKLSKRERRWSPEPPVGPALLGAFAAELGWAEEAAPLTASQWLELYRGRSPWPTTAEVPCG